MKSPARTVIGIDVGGARKGFHAVALQGGKFEPFDFHGPEEANEWILAKAPKAIAIDSPCAWAVSGGSRLAERTLSVGGKPIQCFKTPTRTSAKGNAFYDWVFNGERLYQFLLRNYRLFDGSRARGNTVIETYPYAVVCALAGKVVPAKPKATIRRAVLRALDHDDKTLPNIDFVDAALCAITAERFLLGRTRSFGDADEGFIVVPN